jgi:hypothetical protein
MYEDLGYDFVRQRQDRVYVRIEPSLQFRFLGSQRGKGGLEIQDLGLDFYEASTICV